MNPETNGVYQPVEPRRDRRWFYVGIGTFLLIGVAYGGAFFLAWLLGEPAVKSIDEINNADVEKMAVLAINRPDGKPDISGGGKDLLEVPPSEFAAIFAPLRNATVIHDERGVYLGLLKINFRDGRKVDVKLHRIGDGSDPAKPALLQYRIGKYAYEVGPLEPFLKALDAMESKAKGRQ